MSTSPYHLLLITIAIASYACTNTSNEIQEQLNTEDTSKATKAKFSPIQIDEWTELACGLYSTEKGDIGFPSAPSIVLTSDSLLSEFGLSNVFITRITDNNKREELKNVVDTASFESLGANFYRDKNHLYFHYTTFDGGLFTIFSDDTSGFELLGSNDVRYQSKIYHSRSGELDADPASFKAFEGVDQVARDKNGYFTFNERITEEELRASLGDSLFQKVKE